MESCPLGGWPGRNSATDMSARKARPMAASKRRFVVSDIVGRSSFRTIRSYNLQYDRMARAPSDLTSAARIRNAALQAFAAQGVAGTSIRDVAKAAGVSPGLVQHHFRSKAGLRQAVDAFVMRRAVESFGDLIVEGSPEENARKLGSRIAA